MFFLNLPRCRRFLLKSFMQHERKSIIDLFFLSVFFEKPEMKIEVFIKNEEVLLQSTQLGRPIAGHYCTAQDTFKTEKILTEDSKKVLEEANLKAKELNAEIVVHDISTFKGQLIGRLKGIKSPTWRIVE